ncbi:hypothetical protein [Mesorhizobium sp. Cs1299R1N3]|uniref:hypothetical protein n=1 Tax=Mesorhizobium sp. Cs1299R1N3 TaxID=3015173 RepID=UPI00301D000A
MSGYMMFNEATEIDLEKWRQSRATLLDLFTERAEVPLTEPIESAPRSNRKQRRATIAKMRRAT